MTANECRHQIKHHLRQLAVVGNSSEPFTMRRAAWKRWIRDLESGKYRRVTGFLYLSREHAKKLGRRYNGFCCLGVLAEGQGGEVTGPNPCGGIKDLVIARVPPPYNGGLDKSAMDHFAGLNDAGYSFKQIAAAVRKYIKPV